MARGLIVLVGATATGKSKLALTLARRLPGVIIGADSRQVYREFDIGTAKPTAREREIVPHYLIDVRAPTESLTLAQYQAEARAAIDKYIGDDTAPVPILVGGTGLYVKAIVRGLRIPPVPPQPHLRSQLSALGQQQCYAQLQHIDNVSASRIHPRDRVRTIRALEVFYVTGQPISMLQGEAPPNYPILQIGLAAEPAQILQRIQRRTEVMITTGLVEEVQALIEKYGWNLPLLETLGYQEIRDHLLGKIGLVEAKIQIVRHTFQLAKRQRTWFAAGIDTKWLDCEQPRLCKLAECHIQSFLSKINERGET